MVNKKLAIEDYVMFHSEDHFYSTGILKDIGQMKSGRTAYQAILVRDLRLYASRAHIYFSDSFDVSPSSVEAVCAEMERFNMDPSDEIEKMKQYQDRFNWKSESDNTTTMELTPGDYVGLYTGDDLYGTGMLRDIGRMTSGRILYEILLLNNIFQRQYPEKHFSSYADVRPVTVQEVKREIERKLANLQLSLDKMERGDTSLLEKKELSRIYG